MPLQLYAHPFSSYCQKVLIALYENDTPFEFRMLGPDDPATRRRARSAVAARALPGARRRRPHGRSRRRIIIEHLRAAPSRRRCG